ncbi:glycosyltransferase family 2 protein [Candidatus Uhrbacteria bacterium]|nr:glycosyltransferase family 2 protein [Candidatus Uhrbacteria bacterium]
MPHPPLYRLFEIIPGAVLWSTFIVGITVSFIRPMWVVAFIVAFSFYWLLRVIYFIVYLSVAWRHYRRDVAVDWLARLEQGREQLTGDWRRLHHCIFLPTYRESLDVLRHTLASIAGASYQKDRMHVVIAGEARAGEAEFRARADVMMKEFGHLFDILVTVHPDGVPGEIPGKGSNLNFAGRAAVAHLGALGIAYDDVLVSAFDVDTVVHPQYFAALTWTFCTHPNRSRASYQPVALYNNNMWESPPFMRVAAFGTTFWLMTELVRPDRLFTFSSHSMPLRALMDVGFWEKDIVTEDSRIFLQCFIRYDGDYSVCPLFIPVSMYTAKAETPWRSIVNLYKQQRRWGWGVEHFPYMCWHFFIGRGRRIPFGKKLKYLWNLGEGMYSWASAPIILFVFSRLPLAVLRARAEDSVLVTTAPFVLDWLLGIGMAGILMSSILAVRLLPPRPSTTPLAAFAVHVLQWALLPLTLLCFGSIPAVEAQTRLMLGKYLGFYVAEKKQ